MTRSEFKMNGASYVHIVYRGYDIQISKADDGGFRHFEIWNNDNDSTLLLESVPTLWTEQEIINFCKNDIDARMPIPNELMKWLTV